MASSKRITASELARTHLNGRQSCEETIARVFSSLPAIQDACNPFTEWFEAEALETACALDREVAGGGSPGLLHGVPICIKDMTPTKGHHTTRGSWSTGEGKTDCDAVLVKRLKAAGAIIVAKTTTAELAFSSFTSTKRYGTTRNPWDRTRTSGGSSGGSAVAVATGLVPLAEGSDMGGSVRIPAAACGVVGFKPSLGRIPMDIMPSAFETFSHFGPLASCVGDAALFVAASAGYSPSDMQSRRCSFDLAATGADTLAGRKIALSADLGYCHIDPQVAAGVAGLAQRLRDEGADVTEVELPWTRDVFDQWLVRWNCLLALYPHTHSAEEKALMDPELVACIERGRGTSAMDLLGVDVLRNRLNDDLNALFADYEALVCPTIAVPAPLASQTDDDFDADLPDGKLKAFDMTHPFNMVPACPVLSLPIGLTSDDLPIGMQIVGRPFQDEAALALSASIEAAVGPLPLPVIH